MAGTAAILAPLADDTTPVWLDTASAVPPPPGSASRPARRSPKLEGAVLAVVADSAALRPSHFSARHRQYPTGRRRSRTQVEALDGGDVLTLAGPASPARRRSRPWACRPTSGPDAGQPALFPRGVDLFLVAGTRVVGVPRSVTIVEPG
jgi:alpha-D-ribose 1-methylphosphonate 5-triphosphate synthase subunit PhnH